MHNVRLANLNLVICGSLKMDKIYDQQAEWTIAATHEPYSWF